MKFSLKLLALIGVATLVPVMAGASVVYTFTATSADCLACGNSGPQPLPSFTLVTPTFVTGDATIPIVSFLLSSNLGPSTYLFTAGTGPAGHDMISILNSYGSYDYDFAAGTLSTVGGPTAAVVGSFDGFTQTGFITITNTSPVPEAPTTLLFAFSAALFVALQIKRSVAGCRAHQCATSRNELTRAFQPFN